MASPQSTEKTPLLGVRVPAEKEEGGCYVPARYVLAILSFLGFVNVYAMRVNLSVALVAMVNASALTSNHTDNDQCPDDDYVNSTLPASHGQEGEFLWDENTQAYILGAFYYGYIWTQLPGGWLAGILGGRRLLGWGVLVTSVLTAATPWVARLGVVPLVALRVLEGLGEGVTFPAAHAMWGRWAPANERGCLVAGSYSGSIVGTILALFVAGPICASDFLGGWPVVFYLSGIVGVLWFIVWMCLTSDFPTTHPRISEREKSYILANVGERKSLKTPFRAIVSSPAVWGVLAAHTTSSWGFYTLLSCLPTYLAHVLKLNVAHSGELSALPYILAWGVQLLGGVLADRLRSRQLLSTANTRKLLNTLGLLLPAVMLVLAGYAGCNRFLALFCLTAGVGSMSFTAAGYGLNHLDIAPRFAGVLMGITNTFATIPGFVTPIVVGYLTNGNETIGQWRIVFFISAGVSVAGAVLFLALARGEEQPWARAPPEELFVSRDHQATVSSVQDSDRLLPEGPANQHPRYVQA